MLRSRALWVIGLLPILWCIGTGVLAQAPASPSFEAASVKPNYSSDAPNLVSTRPGGRFTATGVPMRRLIQVAYRLQNFQIVNDPDWIGKERFDIVAKAASNLPPTMLGSPPGPIELMLQSLLAERFHLAVHHETREFNVYALVLARPDGKLGPQIRPTVVGCLTPGSPPANGQPNAEPICGISMPVGDVAAKGVTLSMFASTLSRFVERVVVDRTQQNGMFDVDLKWTPDQSAIESPGTSDDQPLRTNGVGTNGPSIFTAIQEQLGLKLESTKDPVDVLVIDHVERPTED